METVESEPADFSESLDSGPQRARRCARAREGSEGVSDGPAAPDGPVRRCLATGRRLPQSAMIRFVLAPDGAVVPDLAGKLPGRGMWLSADRGSIKTACARNLFAKAARARARPSEDLADRVEALLARRCVETLSLARRAGEAVSGFEKVRAAVQRGPLGALLEAADAAEDGRRKIAAARAAQAVGEKAHGEKAQGEKAQGEQAAVPVVAVLSAEEIGAAFGRPRAVHCALAPGGLAAKLVRDARRLEGFRAGSRAAAAAIRPAAEPTTKDSDE
ncbi:MAG: RNA-binding protein [Alphaproteobacteria bacterium]|nr:RNA-binding protein [Alphaproteobacteria bacterium]